MSSTIAIINLPGEENKMAYVTPGEHSQFQQVALDNPVIRTRDLEKVFSGETVVSGVTFEVPAGSIFGFIGPSGSGKTTTVRILTGIYAPTSGDVEVLGSHPKNFSQGLRAKLGYMPQLFVLYPNLTVWENLNFAASIYGMSLGRKSRLFQVLEFVELKEHRHKLARDISGGMQRRLALASTLVHRPELIFLDEPTAGIDPVLRRKFWEHFKSLQDAGRTLFITTQYVNEAAYCDYVGVMANGKLLVVDTPDGLRHRAYGGEMVDLRTVDPLDYRFVDELEQLPMVRGSVVRTGSKSVRIVVEDTGTAIPELMEWSRAKNIRFDSIEEYKPPFEDVFVELIQEDARNE
jgi:ABC-2 type transport system ATP-binding protein